ncbi:hypothetical protein VE00_07991 [Pseudogymnoascus sp. WSF 3629]|nr:hypothetical protein VE00_07991 [Pseudogymnoascus sp. WSF 3629]
MDRGDRSPERRPSKRKARELSPGDIGQELRQSRGGPRGYRGALWNLDYRFEYYDTRWNLNAGERMLSYTEFKELAEELNTTMITAIHSEGMKRHREKQVKKDYRMVKPTVLPTAPPTPIGPRADSVTSSNSPWPKQTTIAQPRERQEFVEAAEAREQKQLRAAAAALERRVSKAPSNSQDAPLEVSVRVIPPRVSPIMPAAEKPRPVAPPENGPECTPTTSPSTQPDPKTTSSVSAPEKSKASSRVSFIWGKLSPNSQTRPKAQARSQTRPQSQTEPQPEPRPQAQQKTQPPQSHNKPQTEARPQAQQKTPLPQSQAKPQTEPQTKPRPQPQQNAQPSQSQTKPQPEARPQPQQETQPPQPKTQPQSQPPPPQPQPQPQTPSPPPLPQTQTQPQTQTKIPSPTPLPASPTPIPDINIKLEHPPPRSPTPAPSILAEVTTRIQHRRIAALEERRAAHAEKVREAKRRCWELAEGMGGEVGRLADFVGISSVDGGEGGGVEGESAGEGCEKGGLFVTDDEHDDEPRKQEEARGKGKEKSKALQKKCPDDLTETDLLNTLVELIEWEDSARELRRQQEGVVRGLEGMGMGGSKAAEEARGVVARLGGLMGMVAGVRWGLEDCLVLMGERRSGGEIGVYGFVGGMVGVSR